MTRVAPLLVLFAGLGAVGCAYTRHALSPAVNTVTAAGGLSAWGDWIKDKGDTFDASFSIRNNSPDKAVIVFWQDIRGGRGDADSTPRRGRIAGVDAVSVKPGGTKTLTLTFPCRREASPGDFRISILRAFENPSGDGVTPGAVIAQHIDWTAR